MNFNDKIWAMKEETLKSLAAQDQNVCMAEQEQPEELQINNGIAVIPVVGPLSKYPDIFMSFFGGTSTMQAKELFTQATNDSTVTSIVLYIDSPGGEVSGTNDFATAIANSKKPVTAYISDLGASAAYWIASQADKIVANATAQIGSIGVYSVLWDTSALYATAGVKVQLVKAGEMKGVGVDGTAIDANQLADVQRNIDEIYEVFVEQVAAGRGITEDAALKLADGRVWIASKAKEMGLIDEVMTLDECVAAITGGTMGEVEAKTEIKTEATATAEAEVKAVEAIEVVETKLDEIKGAKTDGYADALKDEKDRMAALMELASDDPKFVMEQFAAGHDVAKASRAYAEKLKAELKAKGGDGVAAVALRPSDLETGKGKACSVDDIEREFENNSVELLKTFGSKGNFVAYRKHELSIN